ncbi:MAG: 4Fe-4S cluster-binding domain-containing protein, partial [Lentisphaeria bacterium]|nr:4Fe-4S cluster-binding domain-containing protein [Lentisphaeria bacterium]
MAEITGRIHSFESFGTLDGPGVRYIVFLQGCALRCSYCHNPDTWDVKGGQEFTVSEVMQKIISCRSYIKSGGVTLSGGEPLLQARFVS